MPGAAAQNPAGDLRAQVVGTKERSGGCTSLFWLLPGERCHHFRSLPGAPATAPGTLRREPARIFVGTGPNGAAVVTGCKRSDFIPRHAECLSLPNKFFHTPLRDNLSSQARKSYPASGQGESRPPLPHSPSLCNLKVAVPRNQDIYMGIIPCIISSSGSSSLKI